MYTVRFSTAESITVRSDSLGEAIDAARGLQRTIPNCDVYVVMPDGEHMTVAQAGAIVDAEVDDDVVSGDDPTLQDYEQTLRMLEACHGSEAA